VFVLQISVMLFVTCECTPGKMDMDTRAKPGRNKWCVVVKPGDPYVNNKRRMRNDLEIQKFTEFDRQCGLDSSHLETDLEKIYLKFIIEKGIIESPASKNSYTNPKVKDRKPEEKWNTNLMGERRKGGSSAGSSSDGKEHAEEDGADMRDEDTVSTAESPALADATWDKQKTTEWVIQAKQWFDYYIETYNGKITKEIFVTTIYPQMVEGSMISIHNNQCCYPQTLNLEMEGKLALLDRILL